jgi:hypothetical protein
MINPGFQRGNTTGWSSLAYFPGGGQTPPGQTITPGLAFATGQYIFTITSNSATVGQTFTNNGQTFTVLATISSATTLVCSGTGAPTSSGTLTGTPNISFSSVFYTSTGTQITLSATTTNPLSGTYSLQATFPSGFNGLGLTSSAFTIDREDRAKVLTGKFYYEIVSGGTYNFSGTTSNTLCVLIYDVTNAAWIQPAGTFNLVQTSGAGVCTFTFQTPSNGSQFQVLIYTWINPSAADLIVNFDDFYVGPQTSPQAPAMSDWVAYTPTFTGMTSASSVSFKSRRVGDTLEVKGYFVVNTPNSSQVQITLGYNGTNGNVTIDSSKIPSTGNVIVGNAGRSNSSTTYFTIVPLAIGNTGYVSIGIQSSTTNDLTNAIGTTTFVNTDNVSVEFAVPITGWSSNSVASSDTDTRVVAFAANSQIPTGTVNSSLNTVKFGTVANDTHAAYSTSTGLYTCPVTGFYEIQGQLEYTFASASLSQFMGAFVSKNGAAALFAGETIVQNTSVLRNIAQVSGIVYCNAGDTLQLQSQTNTTTPSFTANSTGSSLFINRLSGPAVITATESVNMRYSTTNANTATNASGPVITNWTKDYDSHNAFNATTGIYTVPVSGKYSIRASANSASTAFTVGSNRYALLQLSGTKSCNGPASSIWASITTLIGMSLNTEQNYNAGDTISVNFSNNTGSTVSLDGTAASNWICIERIGN